MSSHGRTLRSDGKKGSFDAERSIVVASCFFVCSAVFFVNNFFAPTTPIEFPADESSRVALRLADIALGVWRSKVAVVGFALGVGFLVAQETRIFTHNENAKQRLADLGLAFMTVVANLHYLNLSRGGIDFTTANSWNRAIIKRMNGGNVPAFMYLWIIMPMFGSPSNGGIQTARLGSVANIFIFLATAVNVFFRTGTLCCGHVQSCKLGSELEAGCPIEGSDTAVFLIQDVVAGITVFALGYALCIPSMKNGNDYVKLLTTAGQADSMLNHILKNRIAGAATLIELEMQERGGGTSQLSAALESLHTTMHWCIMRQSMMDLVSGCYNSTKSPVTIKGFLDKASHFAGGASVTIQHATEPSETFLCDEKMALLSFENGVSNAIAHGDGKEIVVGATFEPVLSQSREPTGAGLLDGHLVITIRNMLPSGSTLTSFQLEQQMRTSERRQENMTKDTRGISDAASWSKTSISTNLGVSHIRLACSAVGGSFRLEVEDARGDIGGRIVCLSIILPAQRCISAEKTHKSFDGAFVDAATDSPKTCPSSSPQETPQAHDQAGPLKIKVCAIDDSLLICKGYSRLLLPALGADSARSLVVCPKTSTDIEFFLNASLGKKQYEHDFRAKTTAPKTESAESPADVCVESPADVVILDQNVEMAGEV